MRRMIAAGPPAKRPPHIGFLGFSGGSAWFGTVGFALLLALMLGSSAVATAEEEKIRFGEFIPVTPPQPAPEAIFTDVDGKPASLADFKGKPAVVNLWATWCQPCLKEMPSLERLQAALDGKLTVAAVSEDRGGAKLVAPFVAAMGLKNLTILPRPKGRSRPRLPGAWAADQHCHRCRGSRGRSGRGRRRVGLRQDARRAPAVAGKRRQHAQEGGALSAWRRKRPPRSSPSGAIVCSPPTQASVSTGTCAWRSAASAALIDSNATSGSSVP